MIIIQNVKRYINTKDKIITIDMCGEINNSTIDEFKKTLLLRLDHPIYKNKFSLEELTLDIYICRSIICKKDLSNIKRIIEICTELEFKTIIIFIAKPQKLYREWINNIIDKYFSKYHIKTITTNNIFKI